MKMKTVIVLAFAVGCGLIAMMGVQQMISKQSDTQDVPVKVLVATTDIPPGVLLDETNCHFEEFPSSAVPKDAVRSKEDYFERGLKVHVDKGDIIRMVKLGSKGEIAASASIPKGMRIFTFKVDDTKTHSGLLQPGDRVDLQITFEYISPNNTRVTRTDTLLEYVEVFASDSVRDLEVGESREIKAKNLSLLVTPEQANLLKLASSKGELTPIMRNKEDKELVRPKGVDDNLLSLLKTGLASQEEDSGQKGEAGAKSDGEISPAEALKNSLENGFVEKSEPAQEELVVQPATWTVDIYSGDEVITHDFILEPEQIDSVADEQNGSSGTSGKRMKSKLTRVLSRPIQGMLDSLLNPKKSAVDSANSSNKSASESDEDEQETELEGEYQTEDDFKEEQEREKKEETLLLVR